MENYMKLEFPSKSQNEAFARAAVGAFAAQLDLTCEELADIKTAVSEAVTNAIVHGYPLKRGMVEIECRISGNQIEITVTDQGKGIEDIELAMQPLYSGSPDEDRSGMGFTVMESFMDTLQVQSAVDQGTAVTMTKRIGMDTYV
ncbi:anti-sigma F factor [Ructibacterium gallinarum]|uniref:Anti-sigma F factor n=1 Tax=Ructibacterium gallinarum TaxID=2779355 RepID=A0A9D5M7N4_9FIRM|nr:anti-sigma F factor [Ructibacterium gallinarum]MBE5041059.1 anti-sigma F factor [Ructibacterium gallinarum]